MYDHLVYLLQLFKKRAFKNIRHFLNQIRMATVETLERMKLLKLLVYTRIAREQQDWLFCNCGKDCNQA